MTSLPETSETGAAVGAAVGTAVGSGAGVGGAAQAAMHNVPQSKSET